jgi:hypothetical protein
MPGQNFSLTPWVFTLILAGPHIFLTVRTAPLLGSQNSPTTWLAGLCQYLTDRIAALPEDSTFSCLTGHHISGTDRTTFIVTAMTPRPNCLDSTSPWLLGHLPSVLTGPHFLDCHDSAFFVTGDCQERSCCICDCQESLSLWLSRKQVFVTVRNNRAVFVTFMKVYICDCQESTYCICAFQESTSPWLLEKHIFVPVRKAYLCACQESTYLCLSGNHVSVTVRKATPPDTS